MKEHKSAFVQAHWGVGFVPKSHCRACEPQELPAWVLEWLWTGVAGTHKKHGTIESPEPQWTL